MAFGRQIFQGFAVEQPQDIKWRRDLVVMVVWWLFVSFSLAAVVVHFIAPAGEGEGNGGVPSALRFVANGLVFNGSLLLAIHIFLKAHGIGWSDAFGFRRGGFRELFPWWIRGTVLAILGGFGLHWGILELLQAVQVTPTSQVSVQALQETQGMAERAAFAVMAVLVAPVCEEMLFRGIVFRALQQNVRPFWAWGGTSLLFALVHAHAETFLPLTLLSLILIWVYERTGNLWGAIAVHAAFNGFNFLLL